MPTTRCPGELFTVEGVACIKLTQEHFLNTKAWVHSFSTTVSSLQSIINFLGIRGHENFEKCAQKSNLIHLPLNICAIEGKQGLYGDCKDSTDGHPGTNEPCCYSRTLGMSKSKWIPQIKSHFTRHGPLLQMNSVILGYSGQLHTLVLFGKGFLYLTFYCLQDSCQKCSCYIYDVHLHGG